MIVLRYFVSICGRLIYTIYITWIVKLNNSCSTYTIAFISLHPWLFICFKSLLLRNDRAED